MKDADFYRQTALIEKQIINVSMDQFSQIATVLKDMVGKAQTVESLSILKEMAERLKEIQEDAAFKINLLLETLPKEYDRE